MACGIWLVARPQLPARGIAVLIFPLEVASLDLLHIEWKSRGSRNPFCEVRLTLSSLAVLLHRQEASPPLFEGSLVLPWPLQGIFLRPPDWTDA
jgi:hypothetical protein